MALRKASAYSKKHARPFTRKSGVKSKSYIKAVPFSKIVKFNMGDMRGFNDGKHTFIVRLISEEKVQIRDNSLEACRMFIHKDLEKAVPGEYYLAVKPFPHHILKENKTAAGAGADRLSSGMKHSYGVTMGRAAIVNPGNEIFVVSCLNEKAARAAKDSLQKIKSKIPCRNRILFEKIEEIKTTIL